MKKIFFLLCLLSWIHSFGQIQTRVDTVYGIIQVMDTSSYYDVYSKTGTLLKHNALVSYAVPVGGYRKQLGLINQNLQGVRGYQVYLRRQNGDTCLPSILLATRDYTNAPFKAPYINLTSWVLSGQGFNWADPVDSTSIRIYAKLSAKAAGLSLLNDSLTVVGDPPNGWALAMANYACKPGTKTQFEIYINQLSDNAVLGVMSLTESLNAPLGAGPNGYCYDAFNGNRQNSGNSSPYGIAYKTGDYITVLVDLTQPAGIIATKINGVDQGIMFTGLSGQLFPAVGTSQKSMITVNFGAKRFVYGYDGVDGVYK